MKPRPERSHRQARGALEERPARPDPGAVFRALALSVLLVLLSGCLTAPDVDWRWRRAVVDMASSAAPGIIGTLTVAGTVDAFAFTDDALWIVVATPTKRGLPVNRLARIDLASNRFTDLLAVGGFSGAALAAEADAVWLAEGLGGDQVKHIDPVTHQVLASIAVPRNPVALTFAEGSLWVLAAERSAKLGGILLSVSGLALYRVDPASHRIIGSTAIPQGTEAATLPTAGTLVAIPGALWVGTRDSRLHRIDPRSGNLEASLAAGDQAGAAHAAATGERHALIAKASARLGHSVYAATAGRGSLWAFSLPPDDGGESRRITTITRLLP